MEECNMDSLKYELRKCTECSCSRCVLNGSKECYIEVAIKELERYEQAFDSIRKQSREELNRLMSEELNKTC
jgi:hypothetical protein